MHRLKSLVDCVWTVSIVYTLLHVLSTHLRINTINSILASIKYKVVYRYKHCHWSSLFSIVFFPLDVRWWSLQYSVCEGKALDWGSWQRLVTMETSHLTHPCVCCIPGEVQHNTGCQPIPIFLYNSYILCQNHILWKTFYFSYIFLYFEHHSYILKWIGCRAPNTIFSCFFARTWD